MVKSELNRISEVYNALEAPSWKGGIIKGARVLSAGREVAGVGFEGNVIIVNYSDCSV